MPIASSPSPSELRWIAIADPTDPRAIRWQQALGASLSLIDYRALLAGERVPVVAEGRPVVRFDSPGRATDLYVGLLQHGADEAAREGSRCVIDADLAAALHRRGAIVCPRQWYLGYRRLLGRVDAELGETVRRVSDVDDIALFYDKPRCHRRLDGAGVAVAPALDGVGDFDQLRDRMREAGCSRVFVKLAQGSAGSGVIAYRTSRSGDSAWTTAELAGGQLFNTRRVRHLRDLRSIRAVVDALARERIHVEVWVPKAGLDGLTFDVRIVVIGGVPAHAVVRLADGPITNLHLGGRRLGSERLRGAITEAAWSSLMATAAATAALFPRSLQLSLDVAMLPDLRDHRVLEVNAFGDFLHGVDTVGPQRRMVEAAA